MTDIRKLAYSVFTGTLFVTTACVTTAASKPAVSSIVLPTEARATLPALCGNIHQFACEPEVTAAPPEDRMTLVATKVREKTPELKVLMDNIVSVPAADRRDVFKRSISDALGSEWVCPDFDRLWDSQPVACQ